jgi:predicted ATPase
MKESIVIRNFGPISEIEIADIRPLTIFIGPSGSGKSTIIKVLALFRWIYKMVNIRSYLKYSGISQSPFTFNFAEYLQNNGFEDYKKSDTEIIYKNGSCELSYSNGVLNGTLKSIPQSELSLEKICFVSDKRNLIPDILANNTEKDTAGFFLKETLGDYLLATRVVRKFDIDYLGVKFVVKKTQHGEKYYIEGVDEEHPYSINLEDASSGTQTVTSLGVITEYYSRRYDIIKSFNRAMLSYVSGNDKLSDFKAVSNVGEIVHKRVNIHIEEPELSLYPESQRSLINFLINRCFVDAPKDYSMTLMMATHSPYIINHINLLILSSKKGVLEEGANIDLNNVDVFEVADGYLENLKQEGKSFVDTRSLSDPISSIYDKYDELNGK